MQARTGKASDGLARLFGSIQSGLRRNPSVEGRWLLVYVHGLCVEYLHLSATDAAKTLLLQDAATPSSTATTTSSTAGSVAAAALFGGTYSQQLGAAAASLDTMLPSRHAGKLNGVAVQSWIVRSGGALDNAHNSALSARVESSTAYVPLSGAHRQKGAGAAMVRDNPNIVLPEPRASRYAYATSKGETDQRFTNSGASSAADAPMGVFALTLFRNAMQVRSTLVILVPSTLLHIVYCTYRMALSRRVALITSQCLTPMHRFSCAFFKYVQASHSHYVLAYD